MYTALPEPFAVHPFLSRGLYCWGQAIWNNINYSREDKNLVVDLLDIPKLHVAFTE